MDWQSNGQTKLEPFGMAFVFWASKNKTVTCSPGDLGFSEGVKRYNITQ